MAEARATRWLRPRVWVGATKDAIIHSTHGIRIGNGMKSRNNAGTGEVQDILLRGSLLWETLLWNSELPPSYENPLLGMPSHDALLGDDLL